jgi:hypothetical protein
MEASMSGAEYWETVRSFYQALTLEDGDEHERFGDRQFRLGTRFPNYVQFWKNHVCPATMRPVSIRLRDTASPIVNAIAQRSYSIFKDILNACISLNELRAALLREKERSAELVILFSGNAVQKLTELKSAITTVGGSPKDFPGMKTLAQEIGAGIDPFPDWVSDWNDQRSEVVRYRNYLTHQGVMFKVIWAGDIFVQSHLEIENRRIHTWDQAQTDFRANRSGWVRLGKACEYILDETIAFLDLAYARIAIALKPLLVETTYHSLWGWTSDFKQQPPWNFLSGRPISEDCRRLQYASGEASFETFPNLAGSSGSLVLDVSTQPEAN